MNMHSPFASPRVRRQTGMILPLAVLSMLSLAGLTGAGIDMAFLIWKKRQLQAAVEAAALAGAQDLLTQDATRITQTVNNYAARYAQGSGGGGGGQQVSGSSRWYNDLFNSANITVNTPSVELRPLATTQVGLAPGTLSNANALRVTQTAIIRPFFLGLFGLGPFTITGRAAASAGGSTGKPPVNVMLVIDNSGSMNGNPIRDAKAGARALVSQLFRTGNNVGLAVFPPHRNSGVADQRDCTTNLNCTDYQNYMTGSPTAWADSSWSTANPPAPNCVATGTTACAYSTIVPMTPATQYSTNGAWNGANLLAKAIGIGTNGAVNTACGLEAMGCSYTYTNPSTSCSPHTVSSSKCSIGRTGMVQAIRQAQATLVAKSAEVDNGLQNFMVILSDGDAYVDAYDGFAAFTGRISSPTSSTTAGTTLTVTAVELGKLEVGSVIESSGSGTNVRSGTTITSVVSGTGEPGTTTTYLVSGATQLVTSRTMRSRSAATNRINQCQQAVAAANDAKAAGIKLYVIGYNVSAGGCDQDTSNFAPINDASITACKTLQWMAGDGSYTTYPGNGSTYYYPTNNTCPSSVNAVSTDLTSIFADIAEGISNIGSRSIPDDAW